MYKIIETLFPEATLDAFDKQSIEAAIVARRISKGTILQKKGDTSRNFYFVRKGLLRSYLVDHKDKEHIFMFAPEGWILSDFYAQTFRTSSDFYIDAIEDSEVEVCSGNIFDILSQSNSNFGFSDMEKLARRVATLQKRIMMLMSASPWEHYQYFLQTYPTITNRVPQKMIASYLGITPEALSKLRGMNRKSNNTVNS
jgi:CRP-like cAMP-binding protein